MNDRMFEINNILLELKDRLVYSNKLSIDEIYNYLLYDKFDYNLSNEMNISNIWDSIIKNISKNHMFILYCKSSFLKKK